MRSILSILGLRRAPQQAPLAISHDITHAVDLTPVWQYADMAPDEDGQLNLVWPDDPDEVPLWRVERETWAEWSGVKLPPYRTKREYKQACDIVAMSVERPAFVANIAPPLPTDQSAREFLTMLQSQVQPTETVEFGADEIEAMYLEWCASCGVEASPMNMLKGELRKLGKAGAGIIRKQKDSRASGKRERPARWIVASSGSSASLAVLKPRRKQVVADAEMEMAA